MAKTNHVCYVCGLGYYYCSTCMPKEPSYKTMFCSSECKQVWDILSKNGVGLATAKETLRELNLVKIPKNLKPAIKEHLKAIHADAHSVETTEIVQQEFPEE